MTKGCRLFQGHSISTSKFFFHRIHQFVSFLAVMPRPQVIIIFAMRELQFLREYFNQDDIQNVFILHALLHQGHLFSTSFICEPW